METYNENSTCPKCGNIAVETNYDEEFKMIKRTCCKCGYEWNQQALDSDKK